MGLSAFRDCGELERYIEDTAVTQMRRQLDPDNFHGGIDAVPLAAPTARTATQESAPQSFTRTNTQVDGVDEADFVKTNGTHIFALSGRKLYVTKSWPAQDLALLSSLEIEGHPREMFFEEDADRLTVISDVGMMIGEGPIAFDGIACTPWGCGAMHPTTKVTSIDISDPNAPVIGTETFVPGSYQTSRRIGSSVRLVIHESFNYPEDVRMWPDAEGIWDDEGLLADALSELADENEVQIRNTDLADWLPDAATRSGGTIRALPRSCADYVRPNVPMTLGLTTIATIDADDASGSLQRTTVVADTHLTYASVESLYVAGGHWWWWPQPGQKDWTYIFKFDLTDAASAPAVAAGGVDGHLINQFAMDEHGGNLRVATTIAERVDDSDSPWGRIETTNRVSVLGQRAGRLDVIGQTRNVADGERIYSARFMGDRGFMVTFRQIDPLFTIDLSNPTQPRIVGELKVPGFSTYIHPIDEDHLLTIGVSVDEANPFAPRQVKLSLFDVSDFANPQEKATELVGTAHGWSEAVYEHKAFNYFAERGVLAIPFSDWIPNSDGTEYWHGFISQVRLFEIDTSTGIHARGALDMADVYRDDGALHWQWWWSPWVQRSVMADDYVYAISDAGIRVANMNDPITPVATVLFDGAQTRR